MGTSSSHSRPILLSVMRRSRPYFLRSESEPSRPTCAGGRLKRFANRKYSARVCCAAAQRKMGSEASPKSAIPSSASPKIRMPWQEASRKPFASKAPETEHESTDDDGHVLGVHAINRKQRALPNDLIDQRRHSGKQEERTEQEVLPFLLAPIKIEGSCEKKEQVKDQEQQDGTCSHVSPDRVSGKTAHKDYGLIHAARAV